MDLRFGSLRCPRSSFNLGPSVNNLQLICKECPCLLGFTTLLSLLIFLSANVPIGRHTLALGSEGSVKSTKSARDPTSDQGRRL